LSSAPFWGELSIVHLKEYFMKKNSFVVTLLLCAAHVGWTQHTEVAVQGGSFVPAGTLLNCTLDEPNFSSQTAQIGDPVLCHLNPAAMFGRPLFPRGAYLSARLQEYRDPGRFVGKGWIQLEFTSLTLPSGSFPLNAKVISAAHYRVDGEGKIQGKGHATRDAVEWSIPILWPIKVIRLPARGPRPAFKGETRIGLRVMEDFMVPDSAASNFSGLTSRSMGTWPGAHDASASAAAAIPLGSSNIESLAKESVRQGITLKRQGTTSH
jgi:hypothetical protein